MEGLVTLPYGGRFAGRRVFVTGHTGFKGMWLSVWLRSLGADVYGYSIGVPTVPSLYECAAAGVFTGETRADIRDMAALERALAASLPDLVVHLAAQPLVRRSYAEPLETLLVNVVGTATLLEAVRRTSRPTAVVVVTSDKCYENRGWEFGYRENDALGGRDVYSASKAAAELVTHAWRQSFFLQGSRSGPVASVRAGNVIGGGDYAEDRIIPDCVRALIDGRSVAIRNPSATRPWQHVLDCLSGYLTLGARLLGEAPDSPLAQAFNFGPVARDNRPVADLVAAFLKEWDGTWQLADEASAPAEALRLHLSTDRAAASLDWSPTWGFEEAARQTAFWYRERHLRARTDLRNLCLSQIAAFTETAAGKGIRWATAH